MQAINQIKDSLSSRFASISMTEGGSSWNSPLGVGRKITTGGRPSKKREAGREIDRAMKESRS